MTRGNRGHQRSSRPDLYGRSGGRGLTVLGGMLLAVAVAIGSGVAWFYHESRDALVDLRPDDLCPKDPQRPPAMFAVLIDQTDSLGKLTQEAISNAVLGLLKSELESEANAAKVRHAKVEVWTFTNAGANVTAVGDVKVATGRAMAICNPGSPGQWDHLYRNVGTVRRQHTRFYDELSKTIVRSLSFPEAQQSPVIEALYAMGVQVFGKPELSASRKRLIVVSDLLQNTRNMSMFGSIPKYEAWAKTPQAQRALPNLRDVEVTALVLPGARPDVQGGDFISFWIALLKGSGASEIRFERVR